MGGSGTWWSEQAWMGGDTNASGVLFGVKDGVFTSVTPGVAVAPSGATTLRGITMPGLVNAHSHAFHRALRGRTHESRGTFWSWRDAMYGVADVLDPASYHRLARAAFAEMLAAGYTTVGEFHYLHHRAGGGTYDDANEMGNAVLEAAAEAGVRITLIDACYLNGGFGDEEPQGVQLRFADRDVAAWARRFAGLRARDEQKVAAAAHSVRAVSPAQLAEMASVVAELGSPVHAHVSEQRVEVDECVASTGRTPVELLSAAGLLGDNFTAVHATHAGPSDIVELGGAQVFVCACPTTERDLGDGIGPFAKLRDVGVRLCLGSDSHAAIDALGEARALEMDARSASEQRVVFSASELLRAATAAGMESLGWASGGLAPGQPADFVTFRTDTLRTAGIDPSLAASAVFAASASDVDSVVVAGETVVESGQYLRCENLAGELAAAIEEVWGWRP